MSFGTFKESTHWRLHSLALSTISRLSLRCQYLPRSCWIDPGTIALPNESHTSGTRAEIYCGTQDGKSIGVKVLRTSKQESPAKLKDVSGGWAQRVDMG